MKKKLMVLVAMLMLCLFGTAASAETVLSTDVSTASDGCVLLGLPGRYITQSSEALARINEIRLEACKEGVLNPNTNQPLTEEDYVPIKWSSDLEYIARIRAAEASLTLAHTRTNGNSCFALTSPGGESSWGEVLAWNWSTTMTQGIEQWYGEKADWVGQTGAVTGHYTQMIDPKNLYVGLGTFVSPYTYYPNTTAGEFSSRAGLDESRGSAVDDCIQVLEVDESCASSMIGGGKTEGVKGDTTEILFTAAVSYSGTAVGKTVTTKYLQFMDPISWSSSDSSVASVDSSGTVKAVFCGTANITASTAFGSASLTYQVNHTEATDAAVAATCTETGLTEGKHCSVCDTILTKQESVPAKGHKPVTDQAVAATCTKTGLTEGSHCSVCNEVLVAQKTAPLAAHTPKKDAAVTATCTKTGLTEGSHCSVCGEVLVAQKTAPLAAHTPKKDAAVAATCTKTGLTEGSHCSVCGEVLVAQKTVPLAAHTPKIDQAVAATCTKTGLTEGSHCSVCGEVLAAQQTVPKIPHTEAKDSAVSATCTKTGLTEGSHCSVCGEVLVAQKTAPLAAHTPKKDAAVAATCTKTGLTEGSHCSVCGEVLVVQETVSADGHQWDKGKVTKAATAVASGVKTYTCKVCEKTKTEKTAKVKITKGKTYTVGKLKYKVTNASTSGKGTVMLTGTKEKKSSLKTLTVPATVKLSGATFKVTAVGDKAFKGFTKLTSVTVGKNVGTIGKEAFYGCTALTKATLGTGVTKLYEKAFMGCRKLKTLTIKSEKLKTVGGSAVKNIYAKATIKVPSKKVSAYKKLFKSGTGFKSTMKVRK